MKVALIDQVKAKQKELSDEQLKKYNKISEFDGWQAAKFSQSVTTLLDDLLPKFVNENKPLIDQLNDKLTSYLSNKVKEKVAD